MRQSNLQLKHYIVTEISVTANKDFDSEKQVKLGLRDVVADPQCERSNDNPRNYQITLRMKHSQNTKSNSPYFFMIELVGFFSIDDVVPEEKVEEFAFVNGSSVLYSTGREVLRSVMSMGPFLPILMPTVCFFDPKRKETCEACGTEVLAAKAEPSTKKTVKKKASAKKKTASLKKD